MAALYLATFSIGLAQTYFGNLAVINAVNPTGTIFPSAGFTDFPLTSTTSQAGYRFTAQSTGQITEAQVYITAISDTTPPLGLNYMVSLQTDSGGVPSGTILGSGPIVTPVVGWNDIPLTSPANVTAGNIYHLVAQWSGVFPPPSSTNFITIRVSSQPDYLFYPQSGAPDSQLAADENTTGTWSSLSEEPIFLVNDSGNWTGNPYSTARTGPYWGTGWDLFLNEAFTVPATMVIASVGAYAAAVTDCFGCNTTADLDWTLGATGLPPFTSLAKGTLAVPGALPATLTWVDSPISPITLVPGTGYNLNFSASSGPMNGYQLLIESPGNPVTSVDPAPLGNLSFEGITAFETNSIPIVCGLCGSTASYPDDDLAFRFLLVNPSPTPVTFPSPCQSTLFVARNIFSPKSDPTPLLIRSDLCVPGNYSVMVYNTAGEKVRTLRPGPEQPAGLDSFSWDGQNDAHSVVASGVYLIRMVEPLGTHVAKVVVIR